MQYWPFAVEVWNYSVLLLPIWRGGVVGGGVVGEGWWGRGGGGDREGLEWEGLEWEEGVGWGGGEDGGAGEVWSGC